MPSLNLSEQPHTEALFECKTCCETFAALPVGVIVCPHCGAHYVSAAATEEDAAARVTDVKTSP